MLIRFKVHCPTRWGQQVYVKFDTHKHLLHTPDGLFWVGEVELTNQPTLKYGYEMHEGDQVTAESGGDRTLIIGDDQPVLVCDTWRSPAALDNVLYTAPFIKSFFRRDQLVEGKAIEGNTQFHLRAINIPRDCQVGISGSPVALGSWNENRILLLSGKSFPDWSMGIEFPPDQLIEYKYVLCDAKGKFIQWEEGDNRIFDNREAPSGQVIIHDEYFRVSESLWRGAGVALPVFSLRTAKSAGVGEFLDIPAMIDWMATVGFKVFQVLPVNDTVASHTWWDSYPYAAISVHALHPLYINMEGVGPLKDQKKWEGICKQAELLNEQKEVDYEAVMKLKLSFLKHSYDENKKEFVTGNSLKQFLEENKNWIFDYAVFSCLRDRYQTPDFTRWEIYRTMTDHEIELFTSPDTESYDDVAIHFYIQYHLDRQLKAATTYARKHDVVLKGDIPIGIFRHSVDAWRKPHLFHLDQQAGAPPDMYSDTGQNWGFPTYNWPVMASDDYAWWKERLLKMADYFDIIRLDHILGFFRIWQMPADQIQGLLGTFYPSLPLSIEEIRDWGIELDIDKYCDPLISEQILLQLTYNQVIEKHFLEREGDGWKFRNGMLSQQEVDRRIRELLDEGQIDLVSHNPLRNEIFRLQSEVLFIHDEREGFYHPRIDLHHTTAFKKLDDHVGNQMKALHDHYFFHRHNEFWKISAAKKLPVLRDASDMLVCGEDLGMVPDSVVPLMNELQILQLNVQRHPEYDSQFKDLHYLSVKGTGNHDMHTLRQWWEDEWTDSYRIYYDILGKEGEPPEHLTPEVAEALLEKQFESNSMWAIIPLQDLMTLSDTLKRPEMDEERINEPENPHNAWCYRFHLDMDDLLNASELNENISLLLRNSNRI